MKAILKNNLAITIADILRQDIMKNEIQEGVHFNEAALATRFGVSRAPIREALRSLEIEGLLKTLPNGRSVAIGFIPDDIEGYYNLRYFVESESIRKILSKTADDDYWIWIGQLEDILKEAYVQLERNHEDLFVTLDEEFHREIIKRANYKGYMHVWNIANDISRSIMELQRKHIREEQLTNMHNSHTLHESMLAGLQNQDLEFTLSNLRIHVDHGVESFMKITKHLLLLKSEK